MNEMNYQLTKLDNGMKVITVPMPRRETVSVAIWVRAGSRYEIKKTSGASHFLEHMLFKGTKKRNTRQIKEAIEGVGGMLNAFTGEECTCYFAKVLKDHFFKALDVLSDMVENATLEGAELDKEKTVILEEIKMYRDLPSQHVHDLMGELLWPEQPLGWPISGTIETVESLSRAQIVNYKKDFYHPANLVVSVAGPVEHDDVVKYAKDCFSGKKAGTPSQFVKAQSKQKKQHTFFVEKSTEQTNFVIGMHGLSREDPDRYKLGVLNVILGANMSSRLFEEVREKRGLAYEIKSGIGFYEDTGSVSISAGVETKKVPETISVILAELGKLRKKPVGEGELRRAKDYFVGQLWMALEDTLDHLLWVCERSMYRDELPDRNHIRRNIEAVTAEDIQKVAQEIFLTQHLNLSLIGPVPTKTQTQIKRNFEIRER